jgi:TldD protein
MPVAVNRRDFLATTSRSALGVALAAHPVHSIFLPSNTVRSTCAPSTFFPEPVAATDFRTLATQAVDAARQAGASYSDIRLGERHELEVGIGINGPDVKMRSTIAFGIRTLIDGAWAFVHGATPDADVIAQAARHAVATARGYAAFGGSQSDIVSTPPVMGEWTTPIKIDPFSIPIADQIDWLYGMANSSLRVIGAYREGVFNWQRELRIFASSEGAVTTQTLYRARPGTRGNARQTLFAGTDINLDSYGPTAAGYEAVLVPDLQEQLKEATEEAARSSGLPFTTLDIGRYPVVCDGFTTAVFLGQTLGQALQLDRAIGMETDAGGSTYLAPPAEILGAKLMSPLLSVTVDRSAPSVHAVQWDDEGVSPVVTRLIEHGTVVNYCASRATVGALTELARQHGVTARPTGCAAAMTPADPVMVRSPHLRMGASAGRASLEELYSGITRGLLIRQASSISTDHQKASGESWGGNMYLVERGKVTHRIKQTGIQFSTRKFWHALSELGDERTSRDSHYYSFKGNPWRYLQETATAPAAVSRTST